MDLDWEYPGQTDRGSSPQDRKRFTYLCQELSAAYKPQGLLVTAAVKASVDATSVSYEVKEISKALDFINLMTYDMYGSWDDYTGHNSNSNPNAFPHNVDLTVKTWIEKGAPANKLVLGLSTYGRNYRLADQCEWYIGSEARGAGESGKYTNSDGFLAYYEICNVKWDNHMCTKSSSANAPYGSVGDNFIAYDDQESIAYKVNNIMKKYAMKGYMFWALDLDDFSGKACNQGRYPLMNAAKKASMGQALNIQSCRDFDVCKTSPSTFTTTTKSPRVVNGQCKAAGPWEGNNGMNQWCNLKQNCRIACEKPCLSKGVCDVSTSNL